MIILMQSGRGGGLTEGFAPAESMFGVKTNEFLIKGTTLLAVFFLNYILNVSCASLSKREIIDVGSCGSDEQRDF